MSDVEQLGLRALVQSFRHLIFPLCLDGASSLRREQLLPTLGVRQCSVGTARVQVGLFGYGPGLPMRLVRSL
jgi:hypothetical protein